MERDRRKANSGEAMPSIEWQLKQGEGARVVVNCQMFNVINDETVNLFLPRNAFVTLDCSSRHGWCSLRTDHGVKAVYARERFDDKQSKQL